MLKTCHNPLDSCELKFAKDNEGQFEGYASTFGNEDSYGDVIKRGAFKQTLEQRGPGRIAMLYSHDQCAPIGKWLEMSEDKKGLKVVGEITPGHTVAANAYASLKHGAMSGLSIGYTVPKGGADTGENEDQRILKKIDLVEISVVARPANDLARVTAVKSEIDGINSIQDAENFLREVAEFSKSAAEDFLGRVKRLARGEHVDVLEDEIRRLKARLSHLDASEALLQKIKQL